MVRGGGTKRCRLSWLTLVYEPISGVGGGCGVSANKYSCAHGAQINFDDLTPYLIYGRRGRGGVTPPAPMLLESRIWIDI